MSNRVPANAHSKGPRCGKCHDTEAKCAWSYPCCEKCTHFREVKMGRPRKDPSKPKPTLVHSMPTEIPELQDPREWQYEWYIAHTGVAHAHITPQARSTCGHVKGTIGQPVQEWTPICKACLRQVA